MTGGAAGLGEINRTLALAAEARGIAMGVGSQRAALESADVAETFRVRDYCPSIPLFANVGAVQLNYGYAVDECRRAVEMIEADALILHLNPLQEALQPEGDTRFAGLLSRIEAVAAGLETPVIVKEVGWGISGPVARQLADAGVAAIDVAGAGGTSWSEVEMHRAHNRVAGTVAGAFVAWGIPTADSILAVRECAPGVAVIASGGLRDGLDVAKSLALGASLAGLAGPLLKAAAVSVERVLEEIDILTGTLRVAMFAAGVQTLDGLRGEDVLVPVD
jgi:isopentenyl-diphosphate delta-isomerase